MSKLKYFKNIFIASGCIAALLSLPACSGTAPQSYRELTEKPLIEGVELVGSKQASDFKLATLNQNGKIKDEFLPDGYNEGGIQIETDPTVPSWAKQTAKPVYDYSEITNTPVIPSVPDLTGYATESYVDNAISNIQINGAPQKDLSDYTTTDELNSLLDTKANKTEVDTALSSKADKTEIIKSYAELADKPAIITSYNELTDKPNVLTTADVQNQINTAISAIQFPETPASDLTGYTTTTELNNLLEDKANKAEVDTALASKADKTEIIKSYTELADKPAIITSYNELTDKPALFSGSYDDLTNKPTIPTTNDIQNQIDTAIADIKFPEAPKTDLTGYATESYVNNAVSNIDFPVTDLSGYTTTTDLNNMLANKANTTDVNAALSSKADKTEIITSYNNLTDKPSLLTTANVQDQIDTSLTGYLKTETDPSVPSWAKQPSKPTYNYNEIINKPSLFNGDYNSLTNKPNLSPLACGTLIKTLTSPSDEFSVQLDSIKHSSLYFLQTESYSSSNEAPHIKMTISGYNPSKMEIETFTSTITNGLIGISYANGAGGGYIVSAPGFTPDANITEYYNAKIKTNFSGVVNIYRII